MSSFIQNPFNKVLYSGERKSQTLAVRAAVGSLTLEKTSPVAVANQAPSLEYAHCQPIHIIMSTKITVLETQLRHDFANATPGYHLVQFFFF